MAQLVKGDTYALAAPDVKRSEGDPLVDMSQRHAPAPEPRDVGSAFSALTGPSSPNFHEYSMLTGFGLTAPTGGSHAVEARDNSHANENPQPIELAAKASGTGDGDLEKFRGHDQKPSDDELKKAGFSQTAIDKIKGSDEHKDAEEFHRLFGNNPNSPAAVAWIQQKIQEHARKEAQEKEEHAERRGVGTVGDAGYSYAQMLLLNISARNPGFDANNVNWAYFSYGGGGWIGMQGFTHKK